MRPDVLVVGGGPAGLAAAIAASLKNFRVTVVDSRKPPINKPCGEGLLPQAVAALRQLGIDLDSGPGFPFEGFRFTDETSSVSARIPNGHALGLRRTALHQLLIDRAIETGVSLEWGARISRFDSHGACVNGRFFPCKWLIGADGQTFERPPVRGTGFAASGSVSFRFSPSLCGRALDQFRRGALGQEIADGCDSHRRG